MLHDDRVPVEWRQNWQTAGMMLALGCIQALRCNTDHCPTGIATQNPAWVHGLHPGDKAVWVQRHHEGTVEGFLELLAAMGLRHRGQLGPQHVFRRTDDTQVRSFNEIYEFMADGQMLQHDRVPAEWCQEWRAAHPERW